MIYEEYLKNKINTRYNKDGSDRDIGVRLRKKTLAKIIIYELEMCFHRSKDYYELNEIYHKLAHTLHDLSFSDYIDYEIKTENRFLNIHIITYRFVSKLMRKIYDKNNYEKSLESICNFLQLLYVSNEMDTCSSINKSLTKINIDNSCFKYKNDKQLILDIKSSILEINMEIKKAEDIITIKRKTNSIIKKVYFALKQNLPPKSYGVYFLFNKQLELKYVGMSISIERRILDSLNERKLNGFAYLTCSSKQEALGIEYYFIQKLKPEYNTCVGIPKYEYNGIIPKITKTYLLNTEGIEIFLDKNVTIPKDHIIYTLHDNNLNNQNSFKEIE